MKIAVIVNTYQSLDGNTPVILRRCLESVKNQTHQDFFLIVIGDRYDNNSEFEHLCNYYPELRDKVYFENLRSANERKKYPLGSKELWCTGGIYAHNYGVEIALKKGISYVCHLNHDDHWHPQHLEVVNHVIEETKDACFISTCSTYFNSHLPRVELTNEIAEGLPQIKPGNLVPSATCINYEKIPLRYRDVYEHTGTAEPSDADLWIRMHEYVKDHSLKAYVVSVITCYYTSAVKNYPTAANVDKRINKVPRGKHTYGPEPIIVGSGEVSAMGSRIGNFCSIADNLQFIVRGSHMVDWVTTYPFQALWQMDVPLYEDLPLFAPITIGNDVWIAANVKIKQGVSIGDGAIIATEAFVTKDVPPYSIVGGNPARVIRYRFSDKQIADLLNIRWWDWDDVSIKEAVPLMTSKNIDKFIEFAKTKINNEND